jgi:geranylgeranyl diphosphate synthase, type II
MIKTDSHFDLKAYLKQKQDIINLKLKDLLKEIPLPGRLCDAMTYAVMAGGKRLRPILSLAASETVSDKSCESSLIAGCAIEFIHTYSLVHDDLPAMDDDSIRRGNPTCHVAFDEATAILAGDALLTLAFEILSSPPVRDMDAAKWMKIIHIVSTAAGCRGMVEGQMQDMLAEGRLISLEELERLHSLKTGALITAAVSSGAVLAGANDSETSSLTRYAKRLGFAFQVTDDILNVEGDPLKMGKAVGTDLAKKKSTYPALMGLEPSREKARELVEDTLKALAEFDKKADPLRAIARYVLERDQ